MNRPLAELGDTRQSVDIDLAWLPVHGYAEDAKQIEQRKTDNR